MNPYEILGVAIDSEQSEIKKSYRKLSLQFHPDRNNSEEAKTKILEINDAYEKIGDIESRHKYDQESRNPFKDVGHHSFGEQDDIQNIFNMMFSNMGGGPGGPGIHMFHSGGGFPGGANFFQQQIQKPLPIIKNLSLTLEEVYNGCEVNIDIDRWVIINNLKKNESIRIALNIHPGTDNNEIIILRDCGNVINEQIKGDIKIIISVKNTTSYIRDGLDLMFHKKITLKESLCGFSFNMKKLNGEEIILNSNKTPTIISPNFRKIIPMMGMIKNDKIGNLIIIFDVIFPETLTTEQINGLKEYL